MIKILLINLSKFIRTHLFRMYFLPRKDSHKINTIINLNHKTMENTQNIGLIGRGHLGKELITRIKDKTGYDVHVSEGRGKNSEVAQNADILILAVKPGQIAEVMFEIREALKAETVIISFASSASKSHIKDDVSNTVVRAMTDIGFEQIIAEKNAATDSFLQALSENEVINAEDEEEIDAFTSLIGCLPGVAAWQFEYNENAGEWLEKYIEFIKEVSGVPQVVSRNICSKVWKDDEEGKIKFEAKVQSVATKGGVTEAMIEALEGNFTISFEELLQAGMCRISNIKRDLLKK